MRIDPRVLFCVSDALPCFTFIKFDSRWQMMTDEVKWSVAHQPDSLKAVSGQPLTGSSGVRPDAFWVVCVFFFFFLNFAVTLVQRQGGDVSVSVLVM